MEAHDQVGSAVGEVSLHAHTGNYHRGITRDDCCARGGDFCVRGHIGPPPALSGPDPVPLIPGIRRDHDRTK